MSKYINFRNNGVFFLTALINSSICYILYGIVGALFGVITVLFSNIVYQADEQKNNVFYMIFLLSMIILGGIIGFILKLSIPFYLFLFAVTYFYYITFNKDPFVDRVMPFFIIFSCMATTLPAVNLDLPLSFFTGICISLTVLTILTHKKYDNNAFRNGLFSRELYQSDEHLSLRAFIYSSFLFLSLAIPDYLGLYRIFWAPLTFAVLLRPQEVNIIKKTIHRFLGSMFGAILVSALFHFLLLKNIYIDLTLIAIVIFLMPTFLQSPNYLIKTFGITTFVLLLLEEADFWQDPTYLLPFSRIYETLIGGGMAICASLILKLERNIRLTNSHIK